MNTRLVDLDKDYDQICEWWKAHDWHAIPKDLLPTVGLIVDDLAVGFLYQTDSKFALLEFVVNNPKADKTERRQALDLIIDELCLMAQKLNYKAIFTSVSHKGLIARYQNNGFMETDKEMTNMIRMVN